MTTRKRPNIIFVSAEQQRGDTLHCCGAEWMITPNLDCLASQSVIFERAFLDWLYSNTFKHRDLFVDAR